MKPIAPAPPFQSEPSRTVVQAYFLLISNISTTGAELTLSLKFTAEGAPLTDDRLITLFDAGAGNIFGKLENGVADNLVFEPGATGCSFCNPT
ncbi:MAG: hypothetical protein HC925_07765 [Coleofasciculaceae cyanobacterium SM2_3_26]|nr:hypothetical protein [Coleofasciculaceae cyanobacterium SM2_3_26]